MFLLKSKSVLTQNRFAYSKKCMAEYYFGTNLKQDWTGSWVQKILGQISHLLVYKIEKGYFPR
jgi:hypothetical protein